MVEGGLDQWHQLRLVAGEAAGHKGRAQRNRQLHRIDRGLVVDLALLRLATKISRGRELPFGQSIDAVILDHVEHVEVAADRMHELPQADRERVAIARNPDVAQGAIGRIGAGGDRGHAPVHRVKAMRTADKVSRGLGGAADPGELDQVVRLDRIGPGRLGDSGRDRVVTAARAQRGIGAFVISARESERVARQIGVGNLGLGHEAHGLLRLLVIRSCRRPAAARSGVIPSPP